VLITSRHKTWWHVGDYEGDTFRRDAWGMTDGGSFYAAKTLVDDKGRRILFGWVQETRPGDEQKAAGWSGVLSLPRLLTLRPDGTLGIAPVPELQALRGAPRRMTGDETRGDFPDTVEISAKLDAGDKGPVGFALDHGPGTPPTVIAYDPNAKKLCGNTPLTLAPGEPLDLRVFVDRSVVEVFANGRACHTLRVYPKAANRRVGVSRHGQTTGAVDVWEIQG
jgi:beta-fructofuranosidase